MFNLMTQQRIRRDNHDFRGTGGLSENNRAAGFSRLSVDTAGRTLCRRETPQNCSPSRVAPSGA
jgi:hypothetical protein